MPADDANLPGERGGPIGFFAYADDTRRFAADEARRPRGEPFPSDAWNAAAPAPRGSGLVVALTTLLLAGTAIGFTWSLTPVGDLAPASGEARDTRASAPPELPAEPAAPPALAPPRAEPATPPLRGPVVDAPPRAKAAHLARTHRAHAPPRPHRHRPSRARHVVGQDAAARPRDLVADLYAQRLGDLAGAPVDPPAVDPPY